MSEQVTSKIAEILGRQQPAKENIFVSKDGVIIIVEGKLNLYKLVTKTLSLR